MSRMPAPATACLGRRSSRSITICLSLLMLAFGGCGQDSPEAASSNQELSEAQAAKRVRVEREISAIEAEPSSEP